MSKNSDVFAASDYFFKDKSPVYLFTNENIPGYLGGLCLDNARVLTVGASGDHAFEAYLRGASYVDTFDINSWQGAIIELKNHMIRNLDYEVFMDFFFDKKRFFDTRLLKPIKPRFSNELNDFLQQYEKIGSDIFRYQNSVNPAYSDKMISYINDKTIYNKLSETLPEKINFTHCSMANLSATFHRRYDLIMLSNIFEYMYNQPNILNIEERIAFFYNDYLEKICSKNLKISGGNIYFTYMWNAEPYAWHKFIEYFNDQHFIKHKKSKRHEIRVQSVKSAEISCDCDAVLILQKKPRTNLLQTVLQRYL